MTQVLNVPWTGERLVLILCFVSCGKASKFEVIHGLLSRVMQVLDVPREGECRCPDLCLFYTGSCISSSAARPAACQEVVRRRLERVMQVLNVPREGERILQAPARCRGAAEARRVQAGVGGGAGLVCVTVTLPGAVLSGGELPCMLHLVFYAYSESW